MGIFATPLKKLRSSSGRRFRSAGPVSFFLSLNTKGSIEEFFFFLKKKKNSLLLVERESEFYVNFFEREKERDPR